MTWQGIRRDTDYTALDGPLTAIGVRYYSEGELMKRRGMERSMTRLAGAVLGIAPMREPSRRVQYGVTLAVGGALNSEAIA